MYKPLKNERFFFNLLIAVGHLDRVRSLKLPKPQSLEITPN